MCIFMDITGTIRRYLRYTGIVIITEYFTLGAHCTYQNNVLDKMLGYRYINIITFVYNVT